MKIEFHPKGEGAKLTANTLSDHIKSESIAESNVFESRSMGIVETLLITIIGGVVTNLTTHFILKLIEQTKEKKLKTILVIKDLGQIYNLPEDSSKLEIAFKDNDESTD